MGAPMPSSITGTLPKPEVDTVYNDGSVIAPMPSSITGTLPKPEVDTVYNDGSVIAPMPSSKVGPPPSVPSLPPQPMRYGVQEVRRANPVNLPMQRPQPRPEIATSAPRIAKRLIPKT